MQRHLLPLATIVTPNLPEASALLGGFPIESVDQMEAAARRLQQLTGCGAVLVKGGHLQRPPLADDETGGSGPHPALPSSGAAADELVVDVLFDGKEATRFSLPRVETGNTHGTGCTLASAIAAGLAKGLPLREAVRQAKQYVQQALARSAPLAIGTGVQRPFNHGFMLADWADSDRCARSGNGSTGFGDPSSAGRGIGRVDPDLVRQAMRLYVVTDPGCNAKVGRTMTEAVRQAVRGGATILQIREKDTNGGSFLAAARAAYQVCLEAGVPLIINDRIDIALALGPDVGVHVGQDDLPAADVRRLLGPSRILGVSVKTEEQAERAIRDGADYLGCGACFATSTKDTNVIGLEGLQAVCRFASQGGGGGNNWDGSAAVPVVAIGGILAANAGDTVRAGAAGVAVVSAVFAAMDGEAAAREIRGIVDAALQ